jgi:hypothetical protein
MVIAITWDRQIRLAVLVVEMEVDDREVDQQQPILVVRRARQIGLVTDEHFGREEDNHQYRLHNLGHPRTQRAWQVVTLVCGGGGRRRR